MMMSDTKRGLGSSLAVNPAGGPAVSNRIQNRLKVICATNPITGYLAQRKITFSSLNDASFIRRYPGENKNRRHGKRSLA